MPAMSLDNEIKKYLPLFGSEEKQSLLSVIKSFLKLQNAPTHRISIEQYNREIDEAMERVKNGQFYTHEEVVEMSKKW